MKALLYLLLLSFLILSCNSNSSGPSDAELEKMTRSEKWECLKKGMTEETVLRILGKPSSKKSWSGQTSYKFECFLSMYRTKVFLDRKKVINRLNTIF